MKKLLLSLSFALLFSVASNAQYDLTITYNSNSGVSQLGTATQIYMHSGASDLAGPLDTSCWHYIVGNWGANDGIGEMVNLGGTTWTITIDPVPYYSTASNGPVTGPEIVRIAMVFRDETGTLLGLDDLGRAIYIDLSSGSPVPLNSDGSPFFGITVGLSAGITSISGNKLGISNAPNPISTNTVFSYKLVGNSKVNLSIFDESGRLVNTLFNENQSGGQHLFNWIGDDAKGNLLSSGVYYYSLVSDSEKANGKLIIVR